MNPVFRQCLILIAAAVCALSSPRTPAAEEMHTLDVFHAAANITCTACHAVPSPVKSANPEVCISCHGPALVLEQKTEGIAPNPHVSPHLAAGEKQPCTECHHVHQTQEVTCAECHKSLKELQFHFQRRSRGGTPQ